MKWNFHNQVVIVTGSARGIGKTIATTFGTVGARVAICDINRNAAETITQELRDMKIDADYFPVDLSKKGEPQRMVTAVAEKWGRLDILVNNARAGIQHGLSDETEDNWDLTLSVGLKAAYFASQAAIPVMAAQGGGNIINISSVAAFLVSLESAAYHVAKAGLVQLTKYLAVNAGAQHVRVNSVLPGFIVQEEHQKRYWDPDNSAYRTRAESCHPLKIVGSASDVAESTLFLCSESAKFITGQTLIIDGGLTIQDSWAVMATTGNHPEGK